jgi:hypothetical protein
MESIRPVINASPYFITKVLEFYFTRSRVTHYCIVTVVGVSAVCLTLSLLMSYIYRYGAPCKARNFNVVYMWTYVWQR